MALTPVAAVIRAKEERKREIQAGVVRWHYLSFANSERFLGGLLIRAYGRTDAVARSWEKGLNPGNCSVLIFGLLEDAPVPEGFGDRLLSKEEVESLIQLVPERRNPS